jgi:membrane protein YdbS with pleckstrin-like domain
MSDGSTLPPPVSPEPAAVGAFQPETFEDADGTLVRVHPNHEKQLRAEGLVAVAAVTVAALVAEVVGPLPPGVIAGPVVIAALGWLWRMPHRRFVARGYSLEGERLRVVRGILFRSDTVVPFGRVQHIDVDRGPLERFFGLATITLHTAGTHNASVKLPGLLHETALAIRDDIRAHIKRETP